MMGFAIASMNDIYDHNDVSFPIISVFEIVTKSSQSAFWMGVSMICDGGDYI